MDACLIDITHNKIVDLSDNNRYEFISSKENKFKLIIGDKTFVKREKSNITSELPKQFALSQNYPNPFNPTTTIKFDVPKATNIKLVIYNVLGQEVATLANGFFDTGHHTILWNAKDSHGREVASGLYIYRLQGDGYVKSRKMMLIK